MKLHIITALFALMIAVGIGQAERIKDIADIQGIRSNTLQGYGLVVGLADTGDTTLPSRQMLTNLLRRSGMVFTPEDLKSENIAVVSVVAELGPFAREGSRLDVTVSSMGDAENLSGGTLLLTELRGADGQVYATANGSLFTGGWAASGENASATKNHPTVAQIPGGAIVEQAEISTFIERTSENRFFTLNLRNNDFLTANRIREAIDQNYANSAFVADAGTIRVKIPHDVSEPELAGFIATVNQLQVTVDIPAVVVINERTGTIVVGENVGISTVAVSQGSLIVKVKEQKNVSQPNTPFTRGASTEVVDETLLEVIESDGFLVPIEKTVTVSELAKALNAIGATPRDLIAIFNALKKAGALQARLEIM